MRKLLLILLAAAFLTSCAGPRHQVGQTKEASKSKRYNANRVGNQFIGIR